MKYTFEKADLIEMCRADLIRRGINEVNVMVLNARVISNHRKNAVSVVLQDLQPIEIKNREGEPIATARLRSDGGVVGRSA